MNDFSLYGNDLFGEKIVPEKDGILSQKYEFPPFSILDARQGEWQERKRAWLAIGITSEIGRGSGVTISDSAGSGSPGDLATQYKKQQASSAFKNQSRLSALQKTGNSRLTWVAGDTPIEELDEVSRKNLAAQPQSGTSIFDPVLTELAYRWFCPKGGQIVDPFAGGSVRGIVAGLLGYNYHGIELRKEQVEANKNQHKEIMPSIKIDWQCGDSIDLLEQSPPSDFIFSCPPYGDLEQYSDDPADLSNMEYHTFIAAYKRIILRCYKNLKDNRFACFVVGDFRDKKTGHYRGFVADTINAFREVGFGFYNDAVLVTAVGSLPIRVSAQFEKNRKLGKTHQNVLVFVKGKTPSF